MHLSVGGGTIRQVDNESDSVRFGWGDAPVQGSVIGATSAIPDALLSDCVLDTDGDGTPDCADGCAFDPNKTAPGICRVRNAGRGPGR